MTLQIHFNHILP